MSGGIITHEFNATDAVNAALESGYFSDKTARLAAIIIAKSGARTEYIATADTDAARGVALTNAILAVTSGQTLIASPGDYYMATLNLLLVDGVSYQWNGARLYINSSSSPRSGGESALNAALFTTGFAVSPTNVSNWSFVGPLILDGGSVSGKIGLWPVRGGNQLVTSVTFKNWGTGFQTFTDTARGNRMSDCYFTANTIGAFLNAEYWTISSTTFHSNATGVAVVAGNIGFANCVATFNTAYGVKIMNTSNGGHGSWVGGNVNHHNTGGAIGVYVDPALTTFPYCFIGTQFHLSNFDLNGMGIAVTAGELRECVFTMSGGTPSGVSQFRDMRVYSSDTVTSASVAALSSAKRAKLKLYGWRDENNAQPSFCDPDAFLPQSYSSTARDALTPAPPSGTVIYNTTTGKLNVRTTSAWEVVTST